MNAAVAARLLLAGALAAAPSRAAAQEILPASGPLAAATVQRLLLLDAAKPGERVVAVGDRGWIVLSSDHGKTWSRARAPAAPLLTALRFIDARNGWAVGHDAVILATTDGGESWVQQFSAPDEQRPLLDVEFLDERNGIAVGAYGAYYETTDGGKTWTGRKISEEDKHYNALLKLGGRNLLILGEAGAILASPDSGRTWTAVPSPYKGSLFGGVVAADGAVVAFGLRGRIYRSTDGGRAWKQVENASLATLMGGSRFSDGAIVLAGAAGTALASRDNGQTFQPIRTGITRAFSDAIAGAPGEVLLVGEAGPRAVPLP